MMSKENQIGMNRKEALKTAAKAGACLICASPLSIPILVFAQGKKEQAAEENFDASQPLATREPLKTQATPTSEARPMIGTTPETPTRKPENGIELLDSLGLRDKVVYLVYGRPQVHGAPMWGSLGMGSCCRTAEESWDFYRTMKTAISQEINRDLEDFALNIIDAVYDNQGDLIRDIYVDKALELSGDRRLLALDFKNIEFARETIERFEKVFSKEKMAHLAITFDAEHFPNSQVDVRAINQFSAWFAQKHQEWAGEKSLPGLVFIYVFPGSQILNLNELKQYYLDQKTLVLPLFDGYGTKEGKESGIGANLRQLSDSEDFPALIGAMEFKMSHGDRFDQCTIKETFETLRGQPVYFFASQ